MKELILELDHKANESIESLMKYYRVNNKGDLIAKALSVLKIAAHVDKTQGQLIARKGTRETHIIV